jgi:5-methylcytosine-specific restriction protein A
VQRETDKRRGSSASRGYGTDWRKLRATIQPTPCVDCGARWNPSFHLDHLTPRSRGGNDEPMNLAWRCPPHHAAKTAREDGGFGNPSR